MLKGKIIINTRPEGSEDLIGKALKKLGASILQMPLIKIIPVNIPSRTLTDIAKNNTYQWLVFTSKNGVDYLFEQLELDISTKSLPFKTAVFGKRTAMALEERGYNPDLVNMQNTSADLLNDLHPKLKSDEKVLLVIGDLASDIIEKSLKPKVNIDRLDVYRTVFIQSVDAEKLQRIVEDKYDLILFIIFSGFKSFIHHIAGTFDYSELRIACLGLTTEKAILAEGLKPLVVAKPSGKAGLIEGVENYFHYIHTG